MPFLLDTNVCIEYLRGKNEPLRKRMKALLPDEFFICSIVLGELAYGANKSNNPDGNLKLLEEFLIDVVSIPYDDSCARVFGVIRAELQRTGTVIGPYDLQIAAVALVHGLTVVTRNAKEFSRVRGLVIETWN